MSEETRTHKILEGIVGSTAHGLATPDSDKDVAGVFGYATEVFWELKEPKMSIVKTNPDSTHHEILKFIKLASSANPNILELLWLPTYTYQNLDGYNLVKIRQAFLSQRVQVAYIGYAESQFRKLMQRGDSFSSGTKNRTNKHARHLFRLMEQGQHLYTTGELNVRVNNPEDYLRYNTMTTDQIQEEFVKKYDLFLDTKTALPKEPDWETLEEYLYDYRLGNITH